MNNEKLLAIHADLCYNCRKIPTGRSHHAWFHNHKRTQLYPRWRRRK